MQLIRDISETSSFWGATWVFGCLPDVHMICDAPIGCFAMLGLGVSDYTDAIPHIHNLTPTVIREEDVINGTDKALKRTVENLNALGYLERKQLIVLSSAESEMIGADHGNYLSILHPGAKFFWSQSLEQDEWLGRDRALLFAWNEFGKDQASTAAPAKNRINIIGPTLGCFNGPSDLHEIKRLAKGIGAEINLVYPFEATLESTPRLADAAVNIVMYDEFGEALAKELGKPYLFAPFGIRGTTEFLHQLGELIGTPKEQVEAFIAEEKRTTLQPMWDLWLGPQSDWFSTVDCCVVAGRSYVRGLHAFLGEELGMKITFSSGRPRREDEPDNIEIRKKLHERAPAFVFGSVNERIYLAEASARSHYIPLSFPGPIVRRTVGTPVMGYSGTIYIVQEIVNRLYDMVINFLPVETIPQAGGPPMGMRPPTGAPAGKPPVDGAGPPTDGKGPPQGAQQGTMVWTSEATERLNSATEQIPYLSRVSATRLMRQNAERAAQARGMSEVTIDVLEETLAQGRSNG
jgi:chlorophyllide a reductase subunit Z